MTDETTAAPGQTPARPATPELERMSAVSDESQRIGEFLDWLVAHSRIVLARYRGDQLVPDYTDINALLAQYFKIDLDKIEKERRALLEHMRSPGERS